MDNPRILIVDDEENIRTILSRTLSQAGWSPETAKSGAEAIEMVSQGSYDLVLLDLYMEPIDGMKVFEAIRDRDAETIVIILTAHGSLESAVEALRLGAYDYLFKPATAKAIQLRVTDGLRRRQQALQRRKLLSQLNGLKNMLADLDDKEGSESDPEISSRFLRSGKLLIDRWHRTATLEGNLLDLTTTEFDLLHCLVEVSPELRTSQELVSLALGYDAEESDARNIIKWHIHQLRNKIEPDSEKPRFIITVRYKGYFWAGD
jgi:DNA-binding response OmpR family regulator